MKTRNTIIALTVLALSACSGYNQDTYRVYKTFDEYAMKEIPFKITEKKSLPYAMVKRNDDTIRVLLCFADTTQNQSIVYINKGKYWYNLKKYQTDPILYYFTLCDTVPTYTERYIQNDTIWEYEYEIENFILESNSLTRHTRNDKVWISVPDTFRISESNRLDSIKNFISLYSEKYPYHNSKKYQPIYYSYYNKILRNDTLYIYEKPAGTNYRLGKLRAVYKMSNLGVIDMYREEINTYNLRIPKAE